MHAEEDKKRKEAIDAKNECDAVVFRAEKALRDYKDKIPAEIASDVQAKIDSCKKAMETNDQGRIKQARTDLEEHMQHIGEAMAKAAGQAGPDGHAQAGAETHAGPRTDAKEDNNIEDAEVEIIDKDEPNNK